MQPLWHHEQLTLSLQAAVESIEVLEQGRLTSADTERRAESCVADRLARLATALGVPSRREWVVFLGDLEVCEHAFVEHSGLENLNEAWALAAQVYRRSHPQVSLAEIRRYENQLAGLSRTSGPLLVGAPSLGKRR